MGLLGPAPAAAEPKALEPGEVPVTDAEILEEEDDESTAADVAADDTEASKG